DGFGTTVLPAASAGGEFPDSHHHRVVPRRDLGADSHRLAPDHGGVAAQILPAGTPPKIRPAPSKNRTSSATGGTSSVLVIATGLPVLRLSASIRPSARRLDRA